MGNHTQVVNNNLLRLGYVNMTWASLTGLWKSDRGAVLRIEGLVGLVVIITVFLAACGSRRRRSRNFVAKKLVMAAYLSSSLVSYTLGSMQSSPVKSGMYPIWAVSLYILSSSADSITAYSLEDNYQLMRQAYETALRFFYVGFIAVTILTNFGLISIFLELAFLAFIKWLQRLVAGRLASRSWGRNKAVADYMHAEHTRSGSSYDPSSMKGFHYLVEGYGMPKLEASTLYSYETQATMTEADAAGIIDIEMIWQCKSLSSEQRDVCLSFSLFKLLRRRFFGYDCAESSQQKTHDFVFKGQLAKNEGGAVDYNRAFKVIEVELAFMYDFFFTKRPAIYYGSCFASTIFSFILITSAPVIAVGAVSHDLDFASVRNWSPVVTTTTADRIITLVISVCIVLLELVQMLHYWTTIWGRVYVACHQCMVTRHEAPNTKGGIILNYVWSIIENFIQIWVPVLNKYYYRFPLKSKSYWQNKIGQYSLLESSGRSRPYFSKCSLVKPVKLIVLPAEVTEAVVQSLQRSQGILTNGESSLLSNGAGHLLWACRHQDMMIQPDDSGISSSQKKDKLQVFVILTWHIATGYCEREHRRLFCSSVGGARLKKKHRYLDVATTLSKYCAYLVVSAPKLLPGHHFDTRLVFEAVAREVVQSDDEKDGKHEAMMSSGRLPEAGETPEPKETIFDKGIRLGKQLEEMEEGTRWKVLADFWAEMLLYLAPSDNVKEHVECLANGGEFITHLWALLTHAGILDRGPRRLVAATNNVEENAGAAAGHQPSPQELPYGASLRLWHATSYLDKCVGGGAALPLPPPAPQTNLHVELNNLVQPAEMVQQQAKPVQNVEATSWASTAPCDIEEIE